MAIQAGISADQFLERLKPQEWRELIALETVEPSGVRGIELILARIGELLSAFYGGSMKAADFAPWLPKAKEQTLSRRDSQAVLASHIRALGGRG